MPTSCSTSRLRATTTLGWFICILAATCAFSQRGDTLTLPPAQVFVDEARGLVISNVDTRTIDSIRLPLYLGLAEKVFAWSPVNGASLIGRPHAIAELGTGRSLTLWFTTLPIVTISTSNTIVDEPDVYATFTLTERNGARVTSGVGIQYRGAYTLNFEKKSMEIEFWNDSVGNDKEDYRLLGMTSDDDWNLQAMWVEPLRIRSKVSSDLWRGFNTLPYISDEPDALNGARNEYTELFLNGEYRGLYALGEKVNRKQLKLKKYKNGIRGELYSGADLGPSTTFAERTPYDDSQEYWGGFEYKHPDEEIDWTRLDDLVRFVAEAPDHEFYANYPDFIDVDNAVDYFLFINVLNGWDNIAKNTYLARYNRYEPYFYVPWDLDNVITTGWGRPADSSAAGIFANNRLFVRLSQDCRPGGFSEQVVNRWDQLRSNAFSLDTWVRAYRTQYEFLLRNGVYERELVAWPDTRPTEGQMTFIETWLTARFDFLDELLAEPCRAPVATRDLQTGRLSVYPNPADAYLMIDGSPSEPYDVSLYDALGRRRIWTTVTGGQSVDIRALPAGIYRLIARDLNGDQTALKVVVTRSR